MRQAAEVLLDEILKLAPLEERIYRHRCVEAWSIVVPWVGYSLSALLNQVEPTAEGKVRGVRKLLGPEADAARRRTGRHPVPVRGRPAAGRSDAPAGAC